jgi:hypothetical protein
LINKESTKSEGDVPLGSDCEFARYPDRPGGSGGRHRHHSFPWITRLPEPKVTMSELVDPTVNLEFYEISSRGKKMPEDAAEFSAFLKKYIARWAGEAGAL